MVKAKDFRKVGRRIKVPFLLPMDKEIGFLLCEEVLRVVPGKRVALKGKWKDRKVFVKLFYKKFAVRRHVKCELSGYKAICKVGLPTPKLLHVCQKSVGGLGIIVFEYLTDAEALVDIIHDPLRGTDAIDLTYECVSIIARLHENGILHLDPHLGNFLLRGDRVIITDYSSIALGSISSTTAFKNLGYYLAQLPWEDEDNIKKLISYYLKERGISITGLEKDYILKFTKRYQDRILTRYKKKLFRESSHIGCNKTFWEVAYYNRDFFHEEDHVSKLIKDTLNHKETVIIKNGRTSTVFIVQLSGQRLVVKRYNIKNRWHGLRKAFMRSRAHKSWENSHLLRKLGIPTPIPVAMIEDRIGMFRRTSYFIYKYVDGIEAHTFFKKNKYDDCKGIAQDLVELLGRLYRNRILHGDTKASNFIITDHGIYVVDLDAMKVRTNRVIFHFKKRKEISRFFENWKTDDSLHQLIKKLATENLLHESKKEE